jgi:glycosyltransferase involved in cell wall biosynthesis
MEMKIVGFVEGARRNGPGIVSVPTILRSVAAQGHHIVLAMGGPPSLGCEKYLVPDVDSGASRTEGKGTFGILRLNSWSDWSLCPAMFWRFNRLVREADFVLLHSLYSFPVLVGYILARLHRKPYAFWPHGVLAPFQRQISVRKKRVYKALFANPIIEKASVIFYSAKGEREEAAPLGFRTPSVIVPEGLDADKFATLPPRGRFRTRFLNGHKGPLILFLARLAPKKGLDLLAKTMQRVIVERPDVRLAIVGPPDPPSFNDQVLQWVKESGIESQTVMSGMANAEVRLEAFADADVYVLPSHEENFGFSVFEAMASGVPVVVSETLNYADEIARSGAGLSLPRTPEAFSAAIIDLIDRADIRREMGACGRLFVRKYSLEETGAKVAKTVECIVRRLPFPAELAPMIDPEFRS